MNTERTFVAFADYHTSDAWNKVQIFVFQLFLIFSRNQNLMFSTPAGAIQEKIHKGFWIGLRRFMENRCSILAFTDCGHYSTIHSSLLERETFHKSIAAEWDRGGRIHELCDQGAWNWKSILVNFCGKTDFLGLSGFHRSEQNWSFLRALEHE